MGLDDGYTMGNENNAQDGVPPYNPDSNPSSATPANPVPGTPASPSPESQAASLCTTYGGTLDHVFSGLGGFAVRMTDAQAQAMSQDARVATIESDEPGALELAGSQSLPNDAYGNHWQWGLDAIDQKSGFDHFYNSPPRSSTNPTGPSLDGAGVNVFLVGVGVWAAPTDLVGRIKTGWNVVKGNTDTMDYDGHDTRVACLMAGAVCGVAKGVSIYPVKTVDDAGLSNYGQAVDGLVWARDHCRDPDPVTGIVSPAIVHCAWSLNKNNILTYFGPNHKYDNQKIAGLLNKITDQIVAKGVPVVVPAGNNNDSASNYSPANLSVAITVGGCESDGGRYYNAGGPSSNYGSAVDVVAPARFNRVVWMYPNPPYNGKPDSNGQRPAPVDAWGYCDGTSMAAPYVTGAVAEYLQAHIHDRRLPTPAAISNWVRTSASANRLLVLPTSNDRSLKGTPNRFLYVNPAGGF